MTILEERFYESANAFFRKKNNTSMFEERRYNLAKELFLNGKTPEESFKIAEEFINEYKKHFGL